jgi:hypothetical protein
MKKIIIAVVLIIAVGIGLFFVLKSNGNMHLTKSINLYIL